MAKFNAGDIIRAVNKENRKLTNCNWNLEADEKFLVQRVHADFYYLHVCACIGNCVGTEFVARQSEIDPYCISISSPFTLMSVVQKARDLFLPEDEKTYRDADLKDSCGHWTDEARQIFLEQLMTADQGKTLLPIAQKLAAEKESSQCCK